MTIESMPRVGIVIPNFNGARFLRECLASIREQDYERLSTIVVDNGSTDDSREVVEKEFPFANLIAFPNNMGVGSVNAGIRSALDVGCEYIFLTDSDTVFLKDTLGCLLKTMQQCPELGILAPFQISVPSKLVSALGGTVDWLTFRIRLPTDLSSLSLVDYGGASLVRKSVFEKVGLIEERFIASWQDVDFGLRARRAGFLVGVVPSCRILHYGSSTLKSIPGLRGFVRIRNRLILARRNLSGWYFPMMAVVTASDLLVQIGVWLVNGERKEALMTVMGFICGISFLFCGREPGNVLRLSQKWMNDMVQIR